jgi:hypothetical protein
MRKQKSQNLVPEPWQVPVAVADVGDSGQHLDLVADDAVRAAVAPVAGLRDLPRLEARFDIARHGAGGLHVTGLVSATVGQSCVVTLEPLVSDVEERVDLVFLPRPSSVLGKSDGDENGKEPREVKWGDPEPLIGGVVDLGALATEFLILGLDPYPRKPDAVFEAPPDPQPEPGPFAALAKLKG